MTRAIEVRWGDELVELAQLAPGRPIVVAGVAVTARAGRIGLVDYAIRELPDRARTLPYACGSHALLPYLASALVLHVGLWGLAVEHAPSATPTAPAARATRPARLGHPAPARDTPLDATAEDRARDTKAGSPRVGARSRTTTSPSRTSARSRSSRRPS